MCNSTMKSGHAVGLPEAVAKIDGRPVLQPACNWVAALETPRPMKKSLPKPSANIDPNMKASSPGSPKGMPVKVVLKRTNEPGSLNSSAEKVVTPKAAVRPAPVVVRKKSKRVNNGQVGGLSVSSFSGDRAPGSFAAAHREQASLMHAQRKMRIAHYGRTTSKLEGKVMAAAMDNTAAAAATAVASPEEKRCSFITPYSDPLYVAYHDEEWGVPVHDDKMLFELLVLTGAQIGLDWATILKKRKEFRTAFAGFDAELVAKFTERQIASISADYAMDLGKVRGIVNNANRILEIKREFGSLEKYLWGFVNHKPIVTNYKSCRKIPAKTSKSESISKDLVRRGLRFVGPTVVLSFMQAAGLTNDHLLHCPRHHLCATTTTTTH